VFLFLLPENCFLVPLQLKMGFYTNGFWRLTGVLLSRSQRSVLAGVQSLHFPPLFPRPVTLFHDFRLIFRSQLLLPLLHLHLFTTTTRLVPCVCMCVCWACGCVCVSWKNSDSLFGFPILCLLLRFRWRCFVVTWLVLCTPFVLSSSCTAFHSFSRNFQRI